MQKDLDVVRPMYDLIEYSDNCTKISGSLWQRQKDDPNDNKTDSKSFKSNSKITGRTSINRNTRDVEIAVPLKYLSSFWRTLGMPLINFEINLMLTWLNKLRYYQFNRRRNIHNNRYKTLRPTKSYFNSG